MKINFFSTSLNSSINQKLNKLFQKKIISSGNVSDQFEKKFSKLFNLKYCTAVNSGTSALHLALKCRKIGVGDEVIIPAQTFIATGQLLCIQVQNQYLPISKKYRKYML